MLRRRPVDCPCRSGGRAQKIPFSNTIYAFSEEIDLLIQTIPEEQEATSWLIRAEWPLNTSLRIILELPLECKSVPPFSFFETQKPVSTIEDHHRKEEGSSLITDLESKILVGSFTLEEMRENNNDVASTEETRIPQEKQTSKRGLSEECSTN